MEQQILGVDVAKNELVLYYNESIYTISNTKVAIKNWFNKYNVELTSLVVFEPTGGYENILKNLDRKSTRLNSSHSQQSRMPSSA